MTGLTGNRVITENYEYMTCQNDQEIFRDQIFISASCVEYISYKPSSENLVLKSQKINYLVCSCTLLSCTKMYQNRTHLEEIIFFDKSSYFSLRLWFSDGEILYALNYLVFILSCIFICIISFLY